MRHRNALARIACKGAPRSVVERIPPALTAINSQPHVSLQAVCAAADDGSWSNYRSALAIVAAHALLLAHFDQFFVPLVTPEKTSLCFLSIDSALDLRQLVPSFFLTSLAITVRLLAHTR